MADYATGLNPQILRWARERAGYTVEEAAGRMKKSPNDIEAWEDGSKAPTFRQLEKLGVDLYKRPVALYFFPFPPKEEVLKTQFRTLPDSELERFDPDTRYALREAIGYQISLKELTDGTNPATRRIAQDITTTPAESVNRLATRVREYLGVTLSAQFEWRSTDEAFKSWRRVIENVGVFVLKRSFKQKHISGFCLYDENYPVIVINNGTSRARQIFTLFHELAHILFKINSITTLDNSYINFQTGRSREIEVLCNAFASEFLLPESSLSADEILDGDFFSNISSVASRYSVSMEVVLRRLLDKGIVDSETYDNKAREWNRDFQLTRSRSSGGNYYATKATYLGETFLRIAFSRYYQGALDIQQLAGHLRVKAKNVARLEDFVVGASAGA